MNDEITIVNVVFNNWGLHVFGDWFDLWVNKTILGAIFIGIAFFIVRRKFFRSK